MCGLYKSTPEPSLRVNTAPYHKCPTFTPTPPHLQRAQPLLVAIELLLLLLNLRIQRLFVAFQLVQLRLQALDVLLNLGSMCGPKV